MFKVALELRRLTGTRKRPDLHVFIQHITGSSFFVETETADTEYSSSVAEGAGLSGGIAGEQLSFIVQARDFRQREVQALVAWAEVNQLAIIGAELSCYMQHTRVARGIVFDMSPKYRFDTR